MIASHHSFGLGSVGALLGLAHSLGTGRGLGAAKFPGIFDKTRIRVYQVSIQIHLRFSAKSLVKTDENWTFHLEASSNIRSSTAAQSPQRA
jgi:hypothetical protein